MISFSSLLFSSLFAHAEHIEVSLVFFPKGLVFDIIAINTTTTMAITTISQYPLTL